MSGLSLSANIKNSIFSENQFISSTSSTSSSSNTTTKKEKYSGGMIGYLNLNEKENKIENCSSSFNFFSNHTESGGFIGKISFFKQTSFLLISNSSSFNNTIHSIERSGGFYASSSSSFVQSNISILFSNSSFNQIISSSFASSSSNSSSGGFFASHLAPSSLFFANCSSFSNFISSNSSSLSFSGKIKLFFLFFFPNIFVF